MGKPGKERQKKYLEKLKLKNKESYLQKERERKRKQRAEIKSNKKKYQEHLEKDRMRKRKQKEEVRIYVQTVSQPIRMAFSGMHSHGKRLSLEFKNFIYFRNKILHLLIHHPQQCQGH